ncbi:two-component system sensor histidine kinase NtrB [Geomonas agri]|uniref:two-component system sensor histidine kinase NtrB n=1 Tax=Geomonas agri TaxID=2873702 RepID=UPI001CD66069|nr:ATP-binding protein [Geomonas agri]
MTVFLAALGTANYLKESSEQWAKLEYDLQADVDHYAAALAAPLWNIDRTQVDLILHSIMRHRRVYAILVTSDGQTHGLVRDANWRPVPVSGPVDRKGLRSAMRPVTFGGLVIGGVEELATPKFVQQELQQTLYTTVLVILFCDILMILALYLLLWRIVLQPVLSLEKYAVAVSEGKAVRVPQRPYFGELEVLRQSIEKMVDLLGNRYRAILKSEGELQKLKNYLANIIDSMPSILIGIDSTHAVTQWSLQATRVTGIPAAQALGCSIDSVLPEFASQVHGLIAEVQGRQSATMEKVPLERDGERHYYDLMLYPLVTNCVEGAVLRIEDVTQRARMDDLIIQTEKMMTVGGLAAGMAHEINNPLGIIAQSAQNIERRVLADLPANRGVAAELGIELALLQEYFQRREIPQFIADVRNACARAARIVANMLQFSRRSDVAMQPARLDELLERTVELAANDYDLKKKYDFRGIDIVREYDGGLGPVPLIMVELEQVVLNLLKNSAQAMAEHPSGERPRITLRLRGEAGFAVVEVEDNGPGMTEEVRRRVFEPFFTTKGPGVGTGLGLSVSYMIVTQNHKGEMSVTSTVGRGTCFQIRLPLGGEVDRG